MNKLKRQEDVFMRGRHFTAILLFTAITCSFVWVRLQIVSISYDIHELEQRERALQENIGSATLRINQARSPARLESLARHKFQMHPATASQTVILTRKN